MILALLYMFTFSSVYFILAAITVVMIVLLLILFQPFRPDVSAMPTALPYFSCYFPCGTLACLDMMWQALKTIRQCICVFIL